MELQLEVAQKIAKLTDFQNELNDKYHRIVMKTDYADLSGPSTLQGPPGNLPPTRNHRYAPNTTFIPQDHKKPWYTTASDQLTDTDITIISEWL